MLTVLLSERPLSPGRGTTSTRRGLQVLPGGVVVVDFGDLGTGRRCDSYFLRERDDLLSGELLQSLTRCPNISDLDPVIGRNDVVEQQTGSNVGAACSHSYLGNCLVVLVDR